MSVQLTGVVIGPESMPPDELEPEDDATPDPELDDPPAPDPDELPPPPDAEPPPEVDCEPESRAPKVVASPDPVEAGRQPTLASQTTLRTAR
ncbi:MAG: hypothetical protein ACLP1X_17765 [Polyangiaceae bacterium]